MSKAGETETPARRLELEAVENKLKRKAIDSYLAIDFPHRSWRQTVASYSSIHIQRHP